MEVLTFEEFCDKYMMVCSPELISDLEKFHNIDAHAEIEKMRRAEYNEYLKQFE